ncbi:MAG: hypothetical protein NWR72_03685 [Bacteroidia bacterium]|nr:hypothetical protein [Bacteroidia bacterium]
MRKLVQLLMLVLALQACSASESIFGLSPQQSMCITGKGAGQDAAFNPYSNSKSLAIVKSLDENPFSIRVQMNGEVLENIEVLKNETKEVVLEKGYELYLDSEFASKARVTFKKYDE